MRLSASFRLLLPVLVLAATLVRAGDDSEAQVLVRRARQSFNEGLHEEALRRYRTIAKLHPHTDIAAEAWWQIARLENHLGEVQAAFDALQVLIVGHPGHFEKAHAEQLGLARTLMDAEEQRELRRGLEPQRSKKLNEADQDMLAGMLQTIIRNGPQNEVARRAHFDFALMLERAGKLPEALLMHEEFLDVHGGHELADDAACQAAYIRYKQWKTMKSDSPRQRDAARDALAWFLSRYPNSERAALARNCLAEVRLSERKELEAMASYYESQGKPDAAAVYWRELAVKFPELVIAGSPLRQKVVEAIENRPPTPAASGARP